MTSVVDSFLSAFAHLNYDLGFMLSVVIISSGIITVSYTHLTLPTNREV